MLKTNISKIFDEISAGNCFGEKVTLVAATKMVDVDTINQAISLGVNIVGDNKVQEFRDKYPFISKDATFHFIGHLQKNKIKYLLGKVDLIQSIDSIPLAEEIDRQSKNKNLITNVLMEINVGGELSKSGFELSNAFESALTLSKFENLNLQGIMAMLPKSDDEEYLAYLCKATRNVYDNLIKQGLPLKHLSMGMSNDYLLAIKNGSNMIRLGTSIFGRRNYN